MTLGSYTLDYELKILDFDRQFCRLAVLELASHNNLFFDPKSSIIYTEKLNQRWSSKSWHESQNLLVSCVKRPWNGFRISSIFQCCMWSIFKQIKLTSYKFWESIIIDDYNASQKKESSSLHITMIPQKFDFKLIEINMLFS